MNDTRLCAYVSDKQRRRRLGAVEFGVGGTVLPAERTSHRGVVHEDQQISEQRAVPVAGERQNGSVERGKTRRARRDSDRADQKTRRRHRTRVRTHFRTGRTTFPVRFKLITI